MQPHLLDEHALLSKPLALCHQDHSIFGYTTVELYNDLSFTINTSCNRLTPSFALFETSSSFSLFKSI